MRQKKIIRSPLQISDYTVNYLDHIPSLVLVLLVDHNPTEVNVSRSLWPFDYACIPETLKIFR